MEKFKLTDAERRRAFDVFMLKAKVGALSDSEKAIGQEAQVLGAIASPIRPAFTKEEMGRFTLLARKLIQHNHTAILVNKLCDFLDGVEKKLKGKVPEAQLPNYLYASTLIFFEKLAEQTDAEATHEFVELSSYMERCFDHLDAREGGKAHTSGI